MSEKKRQLIKTTSATGYRHILGGSGKILGLFMQFHHFLEDKDELLFLSEPVSIDGDKSFSWYTELEGDIHSFSELDDKEKEKLKYQAGRQLNAINAIIANLSDKEQESMAQALSKALEIPDESSLYRVGSSAVLIQWGSIIDKFNAETGILRDIIASVKANICFKILDYQRQPVAATPITVRTDDREEVITTDKNGMLTINGIPLYSDVMVKIPTQDNSFFQETHSCDEPEQETEIILPAPPQTMLFKLVNKNNKPLKHISLDIDVGGTATTKASDEHGVIALKNIPAGTDVVISKTDENFVPLTQTFSCRDENNEYQIRLKTKSTGGFPILWPGICMLIAALVIFFLFFHDPPPAPIPVDDSATFKIKIVDAQDNDPVAGATVILLYPGVPQVEKTVDVSGMTRFDDLPTGTEITVAAEAPEYIEQKKTFQCCQDTVQTLALVPKKVHDHLQGATGVVRVNLSWHNCADLDLYVIDPCGNLINRKVAKKEVLCNGKSGMLDLDKIPSCGDGTQQDHQENVSWTIDAPKGSYEVKVEYYNDKNQGHTPFTITVIKGVERKEYSGILKVKKEIRRVVTFSVE